MQLGSWFYITASTPFTSLMAFRAFSPRIIPTSVFRRSVEHFLEKEYGSEVRFTVTLCADHVRFTEIPTTLYGQKDITRFLNGQKRINIKMKVRNPQGLVREVEVVKDVSIKSQT